MMKPPRLTVLFLVLLVSCSPAARRQQNIHDAAHRPTEPTADIAVNLGLKYENDLRDLYDALASAGVPCGLRAMSLDAEQIVVERRGFDRARNILTNIISRHHLTVRVYSSPSQPDPSSHQRLEVWEKGRKVREEDYKLYLSPYTGRD